MFRGGLKLNKNKENKVVQIDNDYKIRNFFHTLFGSFIKNNVDVLVLITSNSATLTGYYVRGFWI